MDTIARVLRFYPLALKEKFTPNLYLRSCRLFFFFCRVRWWKSESKFEQEHGQTDGQKWPKISGDEGAAGIMSLVPGVKNLWLQNGLGHIRFTTACRLRCDSYWSWTFWIIRMTLHDGEKALLTSLMLARAIFFTVCLTVFPFEFRPWTFTIGFYRKRSIRSELVILECSFVGTFYMQPSVFATTWDRVQYGLPFFFFFCSMELEKAAYEVPQILSPWRASLSLSCKS